jgi:hypothetical protein
MILDCQAQSLRGRYKQFRKDFREKSSYLTDHTYEQMPDKWWRTFKYIERLVVEMEKIQKERGMDMSEVDNFKKHLGSVKTFRGREKHEILESIKLKKEFSLSLRNYLKSL